MTPQPLPLNVVHVLLQYIAPPSQLTNPLPPHLLSKPLLQRHHFLRLTPEQPHEYLCWPSSPERKAHIIDLLESRPRPIDEDQPFDYPVQYSFDGEDFYAHVDLSGHGGEGARVILQWDESGEWKYHNTDLMPFPPGSRSALEDVLVPPVPPNPVSLPTLSAATYTRSYDHDVPQDDSDDDDYWNAYGATDIGHGLHGSGTAPVSAKDNVSSEDAYWAQYASVHGTADSTIPSPVQQNRRKPLPVPLDADHDMTSPAPLPVPVRVASEDTYAEPLPISPALAPRPRSNSRWDPASPTALARLLASITPRETPSPSPAADASFDIEEELSSPTVGGSNDSDLSSSPGLGLSGVDAAVAATIIAEHESMARALDAHHSRPMLAEGSSGVQEADSDSAEDEDEADLRVALEGVWKMWKKSKRKAARFDPRDDSEAGEKAQTTMDDESVKTVSDFAIWKGLLEEQTALIEKTFARNADLEARVEELERELSVWKEAFKTADGDRKVLTKNVLKLERSIGALKEEHPLILCLIDGDGNIFSADLIKQGQAGGRQAAMLLTKGLTDHLASIDPSEASRPGRGQVWLTIYCNKSGLVETLTANAVCTAEEFEAFVLGFNQSSPLFSIVDVGNGKEAADSKIKECLRVFTRFPQTSKVFFGGAHDNGYTSTLNLLQNEGLLDKVILLKGYKDLAHEIDSLNLPQLEIEGIFITKKLYTNGTKKAAAAAAAAAARPAIVVSTATSSPKSVNSPKPAKQPALQQVQEAEKARSKAGTPVSKGAKPANPTREPRPLDPTQPLHKQKPPPCNFHYLARCNNGDHCKYEHHYPLTPEQIAELRINAKKWPCPAVNNGNRCPLGDACIMNHYCPKGPKCMFRKQGKCKFIGKDMHNPQNGKDMSSPMSPMSPSMLGSPLSQGFGDHPLSPLASPFPDGPIPFRMPMYEGVDARPFSPPGLAPNFLGFQDYTMPQGNCCIYCCPICTLYFYNVMWTSAILENMGLGEPFQPVVKSKAKPSKPAQSRKRQAPPHNPDSDSDSQAEERPKKAAKVDGEDGAVGLRRSSRNKGKTLNYNEDGQNSVAAARALPRVISASAERAGMQGAPRDSMKRTHDPKTYGAIPGIPVGTWWETRQACSVDAVHAPWVAGISAGPQGAYSVALSGGYEDDVDLGEAFTFTGSGGRDLKGTKDKPKNLRTAPQSCDQSFENPYNKALKKSCETKKPIRVIRGYKLDSPFAPAEGYRYDGLYTVEKAWMERGLNPKGYLVCKFALKRLPGQAPLQYGDDDEESNDSEGRASSASPAEEDAVKSDVAGVKDEDDSKSGVADVKAEGDAKSNAVEVKDEGDAKSDVAEVEDEDDVKPQAA
ncbi:hypothetical protein OH77DRAFT_1508535 [Trametes cingulata]|nr:hypothetical protein OH77DRAFT_1508535 [Trametes cingulata]